RKAGSRPGGIMRSNTRTRRTASSTMRHAPSNPPAIRSGMLTLGPTISPTTSRSNAPITIPATTKVAINTIHVGGGADFQKGRKQRGQFRRGDLAEDRCQAAKQAGHEAHDHCDEQADVDRQVEQVAREKIAHRLLASS